MRILQPFLHLCLGLAALPAAAGAEPLRQSPYVVVPEAKLAEKGGNGVTSKLIYVNDCKPDGCMIRAGGYDDARENISIVPAQDSLLSPFVHTQEVWDATLQCLREVYGPYDVEIVTEDPGDALHHEAILAGTPEEMGLDENIGGIAPFACNPQNNAISFSFANGTDPDWITLCWTVAQESAHAFGLDHAFECLDPLTYIPNCGQKFFRNDFLPCGESMERPCYCGGNVQNSHITLLQVFGAGTPPPPPVVEIHVPADGAAVQNGFVVQATASDPRLVDRLELRVNGWLYETIEGHGYFDRNNPYAFYDIPQDLPDGIMDLEVTAYNNLDVAATAKVTVTKGAPCASADTCLAGQQCDEGRCMWPPPTGQIGDACERAMDCVSLLCPQNGDERLCSEYCAPQLEDQCASGFECLPVGDTGVCWPVADGGCCSVSRTGAPTAGQIALLLMVAAVIGRRRRRGVRQR